MRRILRVLLLLLALAAILLAAEWTRERFSARATNLSVFDAAAIGKLDTDMWRSYYERRPVRLFQQMITLLRTQFGMRPLEATTNAYSCRACGIRLQGRTQPRRL